MGKYYAGISVIILLLTLNGCSSYDVTDPNRPLPTKDIVGEYNLDFEGYHGTMEMKENGTYNQKLWKNGNEDPIYSGGWEKWSRDSEMPSSTLSSDPIHGDLPSWQYEFTFENFYNIKKLTIYDVSTTNIRIIEGFEEYTGFDEWKKKP